MEGLKPCPFCGGEARLEAIDFDDYDYTNPSEVIWWVRCSVCGAETDEYSTPTEAAAIKAWNTRVMPCGDCLMGMKPMTDENMAACGWVRERTCKPIWDEDGFACNKCGYWWPLKHYDNGIPCYCPNCGAKVVER